MSRGCFEGAVSVALCVGALGGCAASTLRVSTEDYLQPEGFAVSVEARPADVEVLVEQLFAQRGYPRVQREVVASGTAFLYFRGPRPPTEAAQPFEVGSFFAVGLETAPPGTRVSAFGKPMVDGVEGCADADRALDEARYRCVDLRIGSDWEGRGLVTGRDEATVVAWVLAALDARFRK